MKRTSHLGQILLVTLSVMSVVTWPIMAADKTTEDAVVAQTHSASRKQGIVRIGKTQWKCSDRQCTAQSRRVALSVGNCQALAELVGPIAKFGKPTQTMESYDLALCNVRAQIKVARMEEELKRTKGVRGGSAAVSNAATAPVSIPPVVQSPAASPVKIQVERLALVGTQDESTSPASVAPQQEPAPPVYIGVAPLELVGRGRMIEAIHGTHLTIEVPRLELIGQ